MKISVIVPVYNNVDFLRQCLNSIKNQTYTDLEIICVDDGSTDGAERIVDEFASTDNRFIIIHERNQGESHARNVGLDIATGEYIAFVDCDDWIEPNMYEILLRIMIEKQAKMSIGSWFYDEGNKSVRIKNKLPVKEGIIDRDSLLMYLYKRDLYKSFAYIWDKLYNRSLITDKNNRIRFDENMPIGGDVLFLAEVSLGTNSSVFIDKPMYHYRQHGQSGCHTTDLKRLYNWIEAYEKIIELFNRESINDEIMGYVKRFLAYRCSNAAEEAIRQGDREKTICFQKMMEEYKDDYIRLNEDHPDRVERYLKLLHL